MRIRVDTGRWGFRTKYLARTGLPVRVRYVCIESPRTRVQPPICVYRAATKRRSSCSHGDKMTNRSNCFIRPTQRQKHQANE